MAVTLKFDAYCHECGQRMAAGTEAEWARLNGHYIHKHISKCPEPRRGQNLPPATGVYHERTCLACREFVTFRKPMTPPPACPFCGGEWEVETYQPPSRVPRLDADVQLVEGEWWMRTHCQDCGTAMGFPCGGQEPAPLTVRYMRQMFRTCGCSDE